MNSYITVYIREAPSSSWLKLYDSNSEANTYRLTTAQLINGVDIVGQLRFTAPRVNAQWDKLSLGKQIKAVRGGGNAESTIFLGFITSVQVDTYLNKVVECDGGLAYLAQTIGGNLTFGYGNAIQWIGNVINDYNGRKDAGFFGLNSGNLEMTSANLIAWEAQYFGTQTSFDLLKKVLADWGDPACHWYVTYQNDYMGINWTTLNGSVDGEATFGDNITALTTSVNTDDYFSDVHPYTEAGLTIEGCTSPSAYFQISGQDIGSIAARALYGRKVVSRRYENVTDPNVLVALATAEIERNGCSINETIEVGYVDKNTQYATGYCICETLGHLVKVVSVPHNINGNYQLLKVTTDLLSPAQVQITLGNVKQCYHPSSIAEAVAEVKGL